MESALELLSKHINHFNLWLYIPSECLDHGYDKINIFKFLFQDKLWILLAFGVICDKNDSGSSTLPFFQLFHLPKINKKFDCGFAWKY